MTQSAYPSPRDTLIAAMQELKCFDGISENSLHGAADWMVAALRNAGFQVDRRDGADGEQEQSR